VVVAPDGQELAARGDRKADNDCARQGMNAAI
jgi:hypothetical protein